MPDWNFGVAFRRFTDFQRTGRIKLLKPFLWFSSFYRMAVLGKIKRALSDKTVFSISLQKHRMTYEGRVAFKYFWQ